MIILCFPNIKDIGNIKTYKEKKKKKKITCQEYIYRISIAYDFWKDKNTPYSQDKSSISSDRSIWYSLFLFGKKIFHVSINTDKSMNKKVTDS